MPNEILVQFRTGASLAQRAAAVASVTANVLRRFNGVGVYHARLAPGMSVQTALAIVQSNPNVIAAQPNFIRHIDAAAPPNDPYWLSDNLWGLVRIQAPAVWNTFTKGSTDVIVADIDTGVNYGHPDLAANMWRNPGEIPGNGIDDDGNGYADDVYGIDTLHDDSDPFDDNGHGTHTAGTIGGIGNNGVGVVGVNWTAKILACKFLGSTGSGTDSGAIECFNYIVMLKNRGVNIRVSNNSWGSLRDLGSAFPVALQGAIDAAGAAGILNVFAAGNNGVNTETMPFDPASFTSPGIVSVAASDSADNRAGFSNYGGISVDLAAPGVGIWSTYGNGYAPLNGTSMATPHVAGAAALLLAQQPGLTNTALKSLLIGTADRLPQWSGLVAAGGRLNVYSAMLASTPNVAPSVALTSPNDGATFVAPATVTIDATASDIDGTIARIDFVVNGSVAASDTSAPYSATFTNVAAGTYTFAAVATDNSGETASSVPRTFTVSPNTGGGAATVTFVTADATTQGAWKGVYGSEGHLIVGDTTSLPAYAQVTAIGQSTWTWADSTGDLRALQRAGTGRVMAAWHGSAFGLDLNVTGNLARQVAIYIADYDGGGRQQRFDLIDASSGVLLDSRTVSTFGGGQYFIWNVLGHVRVQVTGLSGPNAVVSGVFVGAGTAGGGSGTAVFVKTDANTQGTWKGSYGSDGYAIIGDATSLPSDTQLSASGQSSWTWAASTSDPRALQRADGDRLMAAWYGTAFSIDLNITGTQPRQVAIYSADYDNWGRQQRFDLLDASTGALLDSRTISAFSGGQYLVWDIQGHVTVAVTRVTGPNAVLSGVFVK